MSFLVGIDIGGTFTDCVVVRDDGARNLYKAPSTPDDFSRGFFDALGLAADREGLQLAEFVQGIERLVHGTTVASNVVVQRNGATAGLLTTRGHADSLRIMRAFGRAAGRPVEEMLHIQVTQKPEPIIPRELVAEISERVDSRGEVVVEINEDDVRLAVAHLVDDHDVEAIAISFLWSFRNPAHEQRAAEIVRELAPGVHLTLSSDILPILGEYERTTGSVVNAMVGPVMRDYLGGIGERLRELGYKRELLVMSCNGGVLPASEIIKTPLLSIGSGPVAGVAASAHLGRLIGAPNIIATDVGGTTFDAGLVIGGTPVSAKIATLDQYEFYVPHVDVRSVGAGGGSVVWVDDASGGIRVGPTSVGADPGPACYGRGAGIPTVTDANLVLGYLDTTIAEGLVELDRDAAVQAIAKIAEQVGLSVDETAAGVTRVVELRMANLLHQMTISSGHDPRNAVLLAYGGGGALHAAGYAAQLGVHRLVVPQGDIASGWSAQGCVASDLVNVAENTLWIQEPFDLDLLEQRFAELAERASAAVAQRDVAGEVALERFIDMRYGAQINEVEVAAPEQLSESSGEDLIAVFERRYEELYGKGSGFRGAGVEIITARVRATASTPMPSLSETAEAAEAAGTAEPTGSRSIYWYELGERTDTPVYRAQALAHGTVIEGPGIVDFPHTTLVIHPGQTASVDAFGNIVMEFEEGAAGAMLKTSEQEVVR